MHALSLRRLTKTYKNGVPALFVLASLAAAAILFAVHVHQFFFLSDDSYITFRYARHVAQGLGPVWNPGERVEGYTSPLWLALMALSLKLGVAPELSAPVGGIASGIVTLILVWRYCRATCRGRTVALLVVLALCANRTFTAWCTGGLETMLFTLLVSAAMMEFAREHGRAGPALPSAFLYALAILTRPEGALFATVAGTVVGIRAIRKHVSWRRALVWLAPLALLVGGHEIWRLWYYGELLPNTFYAKVGGLWLEQAARYFRLIHEDYGFGYFLPILVAAPILQPRFDVRFFFAAIALHLVYVAAIGGDRFEFRFVVPVMPLSFLIFADGLHGAAALLRRWLSRRAVTAGAVAVGIAFLACLITGSRRAESKLTRHEVESIAGMRTYARRRAAEGRFLRRLVEQGSLRPETVLAVGGAGALPYYSQLPVVDRRGLNDHYIARLPIGARGVIAHEHDAPLSYLRARGVVMFDVLNHIVHETKMPECRAVDCDALGESTSPGAAGQDSGQHVTHGGTALPLLTVRVQDQYLIFAAVQPVDDVLRFIPGGSVVVP
jgi:hypothetical protein